MKFPILKLLIPLLLLGAGFGGWWWLLRTGPQPAAIPAPAFVPWIEAVTAQPAPHAIQLQVMGEIRAARELTVASEVPGRVVSLAPGLQIGAAFEAGAELVRLDDADARQSLAAAIAEQARARAALAMAEGEASSARADWESLGEGEASPLARHEPQLALAEALLAASAVRLDQATTALERCVIRAPFAGVTLQRHVEIGSVLAPGQALAQVQSAREYEARLPLSLADFALLGLQLGAALPPLEVALTANVGESAVRWSGRLSRIEAALDPRDRTLFVRAELLLESGPLPLSGLFVTGTITGPQSEDVARLPRSALRGAGEVLIVDGENRLRRRAIELVQIVEDEVFVRGLRNGERVCVLPPPIVAEGMSVRIAAPAPAR